MDRLSCSPRTVWIVQVGSPCLPPHKSIYFPPSGFTGDNFTSNTSLPTPTAIILSTGPQFSWVMIVSRGKSCLSLPSYAHFTVTSLIESLLSLLRYFPRNSAAFGDEPSRDCMVSLSLSKLSEDCTRMT